MLPVADAERLILDLIQPLSETETVSLESATGRILAASVTSGLDFPYWDNSAMDGYAVRWEDLKSCDRAHPQTLPIIEEIPAGSQPQKTLESGQAARIFTGAIMPPGADAVIMQEDTERNGDTVTILAAPQPYDFVRKKGEYYQAGTTLLKAGTLIEAPELALLASAKCNPLKVYRRPRVAIFSTGDELITPDQSLTPGKIVDSNQYALTAFLISQGAVPINLGIVPDQPQQLKATISRALRTADFVLSTGGVSVGDYDYVEEVLTQLGGKIHLTSVAIKPGKPLTVATFNQNNQSCIYFGIPGNPVSALVTCWRFVKPALQKLSGNGEDPRDKFIQGRTNQELKASGKRETYLWGNLAWKGTEYEFNLAGGVHSSGNLINLATTNALAIVPVGETVIHPGSMVKIMTFR
ncbi:gephyrin-like molybdotransferase Glp [Spirulina subsalsa]|uniref:molybdopterin molybdotransferase MoeA n=1 Tax=Spirulina subsalsa TaxID=54311 RepID=UPI0002F1F198|nr:gephyrin-like molybdotransferase Glp [Spirulina subsalsa]